MKSESKELSDNGSVTIIRTAAILTIALILNSMIGCERENRKYIAQQAVIDAQLKVIRMQLGIVEGNEHVAR